MTKEPNDSAALLANLQRKTFQYFWTEVNPTNGLVVDSTKEGWPSSIAATSMALAIYPIGVQRGFITRKEAVARTLTTLRFFWQSPQEPRPTRPVIGVSIITFSICKPGSAYGTVNSRPSVFSLREETLRNCPSPP